jgi:poly(A) polymerase
MAPQPACTLPLPDWLSPALRDLARLLADARFAGGPVRDTLLGRAVRDLDMATPLLPEAVMARLAEAGIRAVPTGLAHGTVTAVLPAGPVEITTLRRDVETDGRHAVVAFTDDWAADARRRDFTMNALYLDAEARLWDPVDGLADCLAGRIRFVGDPAARVAEDRLRILRFYRFFAHYGRAAPDEADRAACRDAASDLARLAGERIRHEMLRLLEAPDPVPALRLMAEDGIWAGLGLETPAAARLDELARLLALGGDPLLCLACLLVAEGDEGAAAELSQSWRLARAQADRIRAAAGSAPDLDADDAACRRAIYRIGKPVYRDRLLLAAARQAKSDAARRQIVWLADWVVPELPIRGADLTAIGVPAGIAIGETLRAVEAWWIARDFMPDHAACLGEARRLLAQGSTTTIEPGPASAR